MKPFCRLLNRKGTLVPVLTALVFFAFMCWWAPLGHAIAFGEDEGFELSKGLMSSKGFSLYREIWNDQPPLHTLLLSTLFKMIGPTLLGARLFALCIAALTVAVFMSLVRRSSGLLGTSVATVFLFASPLFLILSVSVMLELPAIGAALLAARLLLMGQDSNRTYWLFLSGIVMGCALQTKLTAVLLMPAIMIEMLLGAGAWKAKVIPWRGVQLVAVWSLGLALSYFAIGFCFGDGYLGMLWKSHFSVYAYHLEQDNPMNHRLTFLEFRNHIEGLTGMVACAILVLLRGQLRRLAFPFVLLATSLAVHSWHRPYWDYYYLHLLVPIAWLSGHAVAEAFRGSALTPGYSGVRWVRQFMLFPFGALLVVLLLGAGGPRVCEELSFMAQQPTVEDDPLLARLSENRASTHWFFSQDFTYTFHAKLLVPPELLVIPTKRFWSGQLTASAVVACLRRYKPEQMILASNTEIHPAWAAFLRTEYRSVYRDGEHVLFVARRLVPGPASSTREVTFHPEVGAPICLTVGP